MKGFTPCWKYYHIIDLFVGRLKPTIYSGRHVMSVVRYAYSITVSVCSMYSNSMFVNLLSVKCK